MVYQVFCYSVAYSTFIALQKEELVEHKTYELSRKKIKDHSEAEEEHTRLFAQEKINFAKMNALKETLLTETRDSQQQIQNLSEILSSINDEIQVSTNSTSNILRKNCDIKRTY